MLTPDQLRAQLGADVYDSLVAQLKAPASQGFTLQELLLWLQGSYRSWTNWFGAFLIAWPTIEPQLSPELQSLVGESTATSVIRWIGVVVILLRFKTTKSVKAKVPGVPQ